MPKLGDYLGQLMSEITTARMHADLEAVRIAELYASHPLLRTMPVPRFRLPDVEMDVPVVIKQMDEHEEGETPRGGVPLADLRMEFDRVLAKQLRSNRIRIPSTLRAKLKSELDDRIVSLSQPSEIAIDVNRVADDLTENASRIIAERIPGDEVEKSQQIEKFRTVLQSTARVQFLKLRKPPPRLHALVTTTEIREAGPSDVITHIRLKITEEAFEWTTIETEDRQIERLVPE